MEQTKENLQHVYNLSVESFNGKDYATFFRNIRPGIEYLSQFLIFDFLGNEDDALDLINGDTSITKSRSDNSYTISTYPADFKPTGRVFCELFPKAYFCKHRDVTAYGASDQKRRIKRGLESCSAEMSRYYSIASEIGSHAGRSNMDIEVQARGCAAFFMGFLDYIKSNRIASNSAIAFLDKFDEFVFNNVEDITEYQNQIESLIKQAEEKEAALLTAQKMQLEAEQKKLLAEQRTAEFEKRNQELEDKIKQLQEKLDNQPVKIDSHKEIETDNDLDDAVSTDDGNSVISSIENDKTGGSHRIRAILQGVNDWDVTEESMDDDQLDLIEYTDDKSMLVAGCAGSGKSVIAMHKAEQLHQKGKDVILIAYTRSLSRFMKNGKADATFRFFHHHYWKYKLKMMKADYVIVDEIQDFTKEEIQEFIDAARQHYFFFGDTAQSIYRQYGKQTMTIAQIASMTGLNTLQLYNNYRLPRPVAKITQNYVGVDVQEYKEKVYQNEEDELPHFVHFDSEQAQIEALLKVVKDNQVRRIGILLPNNFEVIRMSQEFEDNNVECEFKYNKGENDFDYVDNLNFDTTLPKIMTYHSAKGLQFDIVILPLYNGASDEESRKALYVAMTRTMHKLYVLYSTPTLLPPLDVPSYLYEKNL
jgi:DNA-binding transcriptional MerR regulator